MGMSKRQKAMRLEEERKWLEYENAHPLPLPPPWTERELAQMDQMKTILWKLISSQGHDIDLVSELLRCAWVFQGSSMRIADLQRKVPHYRGLSQYAAKENLWRKIYQNFSGLCSELEHLRNSRERGGTNVQ
jgi:hypothetical protein